MNDMQTETLLHCLSKIAEQLEVIAYEISLSRNPNLSTPTDSRMVHQAPQPATVQSNPTAGQGAAPKVARQATPEASITRVETAPGVSDTAAQGVPGRVAGPASAVLSLTDMNQALVAKAQTIEQGMAKIFQILASYDGADKINKIPEQQWPAVLQQVNALQ